MSHRHEKSALDRAFIRNVLRQCYQAPPWMNITHILSAGSLYKSSVCNSSSSSTQRIVVVIKEITKCFVAPYTCTKAIFLALNIPPATENCKAKKKTRAKTKNPKFQREEVSILRPPGYEPGALPLRYLARKLVRIIIDLQILYRFTRVSKFSVWREFQINVEHSTFRDIFNSSSTGPLWPLTVKQSLRLDL